MFRIKNVNHTSASEQPVVLAIAPFPSYVLSCPFISEDKNTQEATFTLLGEDPGYPSSIRIGLYHKPLANAGQGQVTISVRNTTIAVDDDGDVAIEGPAGVVISGFAPGHTIDADGFKLLLQQTFSWMFPGNVTGSQEVVGALCDAFWAFFRHGVANVDLGTVPEVA